MASVSIIIPTRREPHIGVLVSQILPYGYEVVVVDDSDDDTPIIAEKAGARVIKGNHKGLAQAVIDGINNTQSEFIIVMDGDGQHPYELLPKVEDKLKRYDLVVVTKHSKNAKDKMSASRKLQSYLGVMAAHTFIPVPVSDPMSGFFGIRRKCLEGVVLEAIGFKIGLEIFVKAKWVSHYELPMEFGERKAGQSKGTAHSLQKHLYHLFQWHLENKVELPKGSEEYYIFYEGDDWNQNWKQSIALKYQEITNEIKPNRLLDCGCGSSPNLNYMYAAKNKIGMDINGYALNYIKEHSRQSYIWGSVLDIPFASENFDTVVCSEVLEHLYPDQTEQALSEITRVLKPKGYAILATPNYNSFLWFIIENAQHYIQPSRWTSDHHTKFNHKTLNDLCYRYGLKEYRYDGIQANMDMIITYQKV